MKKLNKVAMLFAAAALAVPVAVSAQNVQPFPAKPIAQPSAEELKAANGSDQWRSTDGKPVMNGTNELCWRDSNWTPATAYPGCDGAAKPPPPCWKRHSAKTKPPSNDGKNRSAKPRVGARRKWLRNSKPLPSHRSKNRRSPQTYRG